MVGRHVFLLLNIVTLCVTFDVDKKNFDDLTDVYRFDDVVNVTDIAEASLVEIPDFKDWSSTGWIWTDNNLMDVHTPMEEYRFFRTENKRISDIFPIDFKHPFTVSSDDAWFDVIFLSNENPDLADLTVVRRTYSKIIVLSCKYGTGGTRYSFPDLGLKRCFATEAFQDTSEEKESATLHFELHDDMKITSPTTTYKTATVSKRYFHNMKYICITSESNTQYLFRTITPLLALSETTGHLETRIYIPSKSIICLSLGYYIKKDSGGELYLSVGEGSETSSIGSVFNDQQKDSWRTHRFVIPWDNKNIMAQIPVRITGKKNSSAPVLIHSIQGCEAKDDWDSTVFAKSGKLDIHVRTNALGLPVKLQNGSIVDPNVESGIPECPGVNHSCIWTLNNWSPLEKINSDYMASAPLSLWHNYSYMWTQRDPYPFTRIFNATLSFQINYNYPQIKFYVTENSDPNSESRFIINIESNNMYVYKKVPYGRFTCSDHDSSTVYCENICFTNLRVSWTNSLSHQMSVVSTEYELDVMIRREEYVLFHCKASTSNPVSNSLAHIRYSTPYPDRVNASVNTTVNYGLNLDHEEGSITSPYFLPSNGELCVSLFYHMTEGTLKVSAQLFNGTNIELEDLEDTHEWKYKRIAKKIDLELTRLILHGTKNTTGHVTIQRVAGCLYPDEDIIELGWQKALQVVSTTSTNTTQVINPAGPFVCHNGGIHHGRGGCTCPPGFTGDTCNEACGQDRFGNDCEGRCSRSNRTCQGMYLCKPSWGCSCAPGYTGFFCSQECSAGTYGSDCRQTCGRCSGGSCDAFTGRCPGSCEDGYSPPLCQERSPYFSGAPIIQRGDGKISIKLLHTFSGEGSPLYYQIQYKEDENLPWTTIYSAAIDADISETSVNITEPSSKDRYLVRGVVISEDGSSYRGSAIPFTELRRNCTIPKASSYYLTATDVEEHSFTLTWEALDDSRDWCNVSHYEVFLKEARIWSLYAETNSTNLYINQRSPDEHYQIKLRAVTSLGNKTAFTEPVDVTTSPKQVEDIQNLEVVRLDSTQLQLKWDYPTTVKHFLISYQCTKLLGCPDTTCDYSRGHYQSFDTSATLQDLLPLAQYEIKATPFTENALGPSSTIKALTLPAGSEVAPAAVEEPVTDRTNTSFTVRWAPPANCSKLNGFQQGYWYSLRLSGKKTPLLDGSTLLNTATFVRLTPHTLYEVDVFIITNGGWDKNYPLTISASTRATTPERVTNLTVYKTGKREIGLRWNAPAQTFGALQSFTVTCVEKSTPNLPINKVINPTPCTAWPESFCFTIKKLRPNVQYSLSVQARNVEVPEDGDPSIVRAITQEGAPTAASYIQLLDQDSTSLSVKWGIPHLLNGILRSFLLSVEEVDTFNSSDCCRYFPFQEVPVREEKSFYQLEVAGLRPASTYTISISGKTVTLGPASSITVHTKPPMPNLPSEPLVILDAVEQEVKVKLAPVTENEELVKGYLLLLVPENENEDIPEATIWDHTLAEEIKTAVNTSFYIVGEYSQKDLLRDEPITLKVEGNNSPINILSEPSQPVLYGNVTYDIVLVAIFDYEGTYSSSLKESLPFTISWL